MNRTANSLKLSGIFRFTYHTAQPKLPFTQASLIAQVKPTKAQSNKFHKATKPMNTPPKKERLDRLMVDKKLTPTRSKARDLIKSGHVSVDGVITTKAGQIWLDTADIKISDAAPEFVSRAGAKLDHAMERFEIDCSGHNVLDIGASTGGFTQVLLARGAKHVFAVDVGHDQLHPDLIADKRVTSMEGTDARTLTRTKLPLPINAITADVSFISLVKVLESPINLIEPGGWIIALIKPQFEVGRKALGKKGIVKDQDARREVIATITGWFESQPGWHVIGTCPSPLKGQTGNQEYLICAGKE